ncbi:LOW QUALITY PROTEIN: nephronectin [Puntigrus tetrazona]|uniref:LOW QUALITY PROTEIN: nephronectin n=1 Tax=Puntigrus tetrazona TaxID=1606681 RepID=UPI001C8902C8|nr:LOW QUALITY PROTEIN: nephronectin [Puntigrus tetrazona]
MDVTLFFSLCVCVCAASETLRSSRSLPSDGSCRYGWTRTLKGQCKPVCEWGCKHGECVGPDQCLCRTGFTGKTCNRDVNECAFRPCKYRCMNTLGSYKCYCLNGFMMTSDGVCHDARTCAMANCQYGCAVMKGEVRCQCPSPGLKLAPDGRTCVDVDECVTGQASCPRLRKCVNTFGSYVCRCHEGFELRHINGKYSCTDKRFSSICYDKPGHKKCKCTPSVNGKGYDCKSVFKVTIEPARPVEVTVSLTTISTATTPVTTHRETTAAATTSATPPPAVTIATSVPESTAMTTVPLDYRCYSNDNQSYNYNNKSHNDSCYHSPHNRCYDHKSNPSADIICPDDYRHASNNSLLRNQHRPTDELDSTLDNRVHRETTAKPRGDVHIPRFENNLFDWDFDVEPGNTEEFSRDDPAAAAESCSFDEGLCVWMTDSEGDLRWEVKDDPAGGRYLSVPETTKRSVKGARLTVALAPPTKPWRGGDLCLSFRHRLHGHHIGSLQVFVRKGRSHNPSIWTRTGGYGWRHAQITLLGRGLLDIVLKAERRRGKHGEISVDDFTLRRGACSDQHHRTE